MIHEITIGSAVFLNEGLEKDDNNQKKFNSVFNPSASRLEEYRRSFDIYKDMSIPKVPNF